MYVLILNDMRFGDIENMTAVKAAPAREELIEFVRENLADEPWYEDGWKKSFKKGSELEWYNPYARPDSLDLIGLFGGGIQEVPDWVKDPMQIRGDKYKGWYEEPVQNLQ